MIDPATFDFDSIDSRLNDKSEYSDSTQLLLILIGITSIAIGLYLRQKFTTTSFAYRNQNENI